MIFNNSIQLRNKNMKIFNWVHRRFNHKDEVGQDATKDEVTGHGKDKLALLESTAAFDSVFDGWKEGILAIGTLGLDPALLKGLEPKDDTYFCEISSKELFVGDNIGDEDDRGEQEGEMEFPLVLKACKHGFLHDHRDDHKQCDEVPKPNDHEDNVAGVDTDEMKRGRKTGERITLADLFWADSEKNLFKNKRLADEDHVKVHHHTNESNKKLHASNDDRVVLFSKKKLTRDTTPHTIKKINRMVRKMLKKKIHPDVENQKVAERRKPAHVPGSVKAT